MLIRHKYIILLSLLFLTKLLVGQNVDYIRQAEKLRKAALASESDSEAEQLISDAYKTAQRTDSAKLKAHNAITAADIFNRRDKNEQALKYYLRAIADEKNSIIPNKTLINNALYKSALIYFEYEVYDKAVENFKKCSKNDPNTLRYIGKSYEYADKPDSAEIYYTAVKDSVLAKKDSTEIIKAYKDLITIAKKKNEHEKAIEYYYEIYNIYLLKHAEEETASVLNNIGYLNMFTGDFRAASDAFEQTLKTYQSTGADDQKMEAVYTNLGICNINLGNKDTGIEYLMKALDIAEKKGDEPAKSRINNLIALSYYQNKDMYNASEYSLDAVQTAEKSNNIELRKDAYLTYSSVLQSLEDYEKALDYFKRHLEIRDSLLVEMRLKENSSREKIDELRQIEKQLRLKIAEEEVQASLLKQVRLEKEKKEQELALSNKEAALAKANYERKEQQLAYERQKREAEIRKQKINALEQEKAIKDLELKKKKAEEEKQKKEIALLESEREKQSLEIEKRKQAQKTFMYLMILGAIIFLLIVWVLIVTRKKNKRLASQKTEIEQKNDELNQQNEEISTQKENLEKANKKITFINKEITDSIRYAERIQSAVLPAQEILAAGLSDFFIFFKPKDIVSGDFYWAKQLGEKTVIAAADCTGHGVPGAFMSMLGISFLNEISVKISRDNYNAAQVLDELRDKVKESLQQTGKRKEQKDGMDIALIIINKKEEILQFAGANNPLLLVSGKDTRKIKGDRMPIGIHHLEKPFKNHDIEISKGDVFYAFSDGYQDQFGGESGRKFMTKRFREMLFSISRKPMKEQKTILEKELNNWISTPSPDGQSYPQMDDILVLGMRV